jgi:hypothetical protein
MTGEGKLLTGVVLGAGAMYLVDPDRGARRRSLLRDRGVHSGHKLGDAGLRSRFRRDHADDEVLHEMDDDFVRLKSLLEEGKTRADGPPVHASEVSVERTRT